MTPREDEFELPASRRAKQSNGIVFDPAGVFLEVMQDLADEFRVMQPLENAANHCLLFTIEKRTDLDRCDVPIVVDLRSLGMIEIKSNLLLLLRRERPV